METGLNLLLVKRIKWKVTGYQYKECGIGFLPGSLFLMVPHSQNRSKSCPSLTGPYQGQRVSAKKKNQSWRYSEHSTKRGSKCSLGLTCPGTTLREKSRFSCTSLFGVILNCSAMLFKVSLQPTCTHEHTWSFNMITHTRKYIRLIL